MHYVKMALCCICLLFISSTLSAENVLRTGEVGIIVSGFKNSNGYAKIAVMDSEQALQNEEKAFCLIKSRITDKKVEVLIKGIPYGRYAIAVYHDSNKNGVLDMNLLGVPKEAYGFSNNVRGKVGPKDFGKIRFDLNSSSVTQEITVR